jgi:hypothetical protein
MAKKILLRRLKKKGTQKLHDDNMKTVTEVPNLHFININLQENNIWVLLGKTFKNWSHDAAWSAPRCGEVNHHLT